MKSLKATLTFALLAFQTARAATFTVTTTADSGPSSLRAALASAADGDTINFSATGTILLTSGELRVSKSVTILGPGAGSLAVNGNAASRVLHISPGATVTIAELTITNGAAFGPYPDNGGAGILNDHATLTLSNVLVTGNSAEFDAGIYNNGCCFSDLATLTLLNCVVSGNSATLYGGGGMGNDGYHGNATATFINSTLSNNSGSYGGGMYNSGYSGHVGADFINSTVSGNSASVSGGAIYNDGEADPELGIVPNGAVVNFLDSTLSGNTAATNGGGIYNIGQPDPFFSFTGGATVRILNSTSSGNSAGDSGGILYNDGLAGASYAEFGSSIFDAGASGGTIFDNSDWAYSDGYNLCSDGGGGFFMGTGDRTNTNPLLGPLQNNGGATLTHALLCGSPAIDQGFNFTGATTDQRGATRPVDISGVANPTDGDATDIGAVERQSKCTPCEEINLLVGMVEAGGFGKHTKSLTTTLEGACDAFRRGQARSGINKLQAFQDKVRGQVARSNPALSAHLIALAQQIIDSVEPQRKH